MALLADIAAIVRDLVPASCPRCRLPASGGFCEACRGDFARIANPCRRCGLPEPCTPCPARRSGWPLDGVIAPFVYGNPLSQQLLALKYGRERRLGVALGRLLAAEIAERGPAVDALVPVPLHPRRLRERTFNQADELARPIAQQMGCPVVVRGIVRRRHTPAQTALDRRTRLASLAQAFAVTDASLAGLRVAVVDDVITTGATIDALARALKAAGAASIAAWAVARTIPG